MDKQYQKVSFKTSALTTKSYSTSFSLAVKMLKNEQQSAIYSIYGFVRFADEIVDSFHEYDKASLLEKFEQDYFDAIKHGISLNPILNSFQLTVKKYQIDQEYIEAFLRSMRLDISDKVYNEKDKIDEYIYGSADVVGLMCLKVFCNGNETQFQELKQPAMKLGSAFQKVNFLRDLKNDMEDLGRRYFPTIENLNLNETQKLEAILDIERDFQLALEGIKKLPGRSKLAVLTAYFYYMALLRKIKRTQASKIAQRRIRISNPRKISLLVQAACCYKLGIM